MARVVIDQLVKAYPAAGGTTVTAVKDVSLTVEDGEFMVLVGPSGCGKSTTLRMIAGLEDITAGTIAIDGRVINDVLPKDRDIAMVFQNYALYPHMSVYDNMAFGLKLRNLPRAEIDARVREAAQILELGPYLERKPKALSGGQRQRVAVGRAIVRKPKVFLFDEPLSNLDAKMRVSMRTEISKLHARLGATMIYVTHDQIEAMTMGDRICVMKDGRIMQVAKPLDLYHRPENLFVAGFIGSPPMNFLRGSLRREEGGLAFVEDNASRPPFRLGLPAALAERAAGHAGRAIVLAFRPEDVRDADRQPVQPEAALLAATVELSEPMGAETYLHLTTGTHGFVARVPAADTYEAGRLLRLALDRGRIHLFDAETEQRLV